MSHADGFWAYCNIAILTYLLNKDDSAGSYTQFKTRNSSGDERPERNIRDRYDISPSIGPPSLYFANTLAFNAPDGGVSLGRSP